MARRSSLGTQFLVLAAAAGLWNSLSGEVFVGSAAAPRLSATAVAAAKTKSAEAAPKETKPKAAKTDAGLEQPKRPMSGYFLWLQENRAALVKKLGAEAKVTEITKAAGEEWKKLADAKKAPYEQKYQTAKAKFEKDLEAFKAKGGVVAVKARKTSESKPKKEKDPNMPKRPASGYMLYLQDNRDKIVKGLPAGFKVTDVAKEAGKLWKALTAKAKEPYEKKYEAAKAKFDSAMAAYKK